MDANPKEPHKDKRCWKINDQKRVENLKIKRAMRMDEQMNKEIEEEEKAIAKAIEDRENEQPYFGVRKSRKVREQMRKEKEGDDSFDSDDI